MTDRVGSEATSLIAQGEAALAELNSHAQHLQRQQRELQMLIRQIEVELQPLANRKSERVDAVRAVEVDPAAHPPADIREAYEALSDASMRLYMMQTQVESLKQREQMVASQLARVQAHASTLERLVSAFPQVGDGTVSEAAGVAAPATVPAAELARQVVTAREAHSLWLSQRMQDGPLQALSNLVLQAEVSQRLLARSPERAREELQTLKSNLARGLAEARFFTGELHPPALRELGLRSTVRRYATELAGRNGREVRVELAGQDVPLAGEIEIALYRIAQDALAWAIASTRAHQMDLELAVEPNGVRFDLDAAGYVADAAVDTVFAERIEMYTLAIGGQLKLDASPRGLHIAISLSHAAP